MKTFVAMVVASMVAIAGMGAPPAQAAGTIRLGRDDSTPRTLRIKPGDDVQFVNATGGRAKLWFPDGLRLFVEPGGSVVRFDRPGDYVYSGHVSGTKAGAHSGEVITD